MFAARFTWLALVAACSSFLVQAAPFLGSRAHDRYPRRSIGGVLVVDTPLIRAAQEFARQHGDDHTYKHIMRSWLFGTLMLQHNTTFQAMVDPEVHALASILHDLGWDRAPNSTVVTHDHRFEVDGAIAAREFIHAHPYGQHWEKRRVQLVWDAIALHAERRIAYFKEPEVEAVSKSILLDFSGPGMGIPEAEYAAVLEEFPRDGFKDAFVETMSWLCRTKPETTYGESTFAFLAEPMVGLQELTRRKDNFMQPYGERFVEGYSAVGHRAIDRVLGGEK